MPHKNGQIKPMHSYQLVAVAKDLLLACVFFCCCRKVAPPPPPFFERADRQVALSVPLSVPLSPVAPGTLLPIKA